MASTLNRRGFLGLLAAGLALDPERLLWRPGAKLISIPAPRIRVGNMLLTLEELRREVLRILQRNLAAGRIGDGWFTPGPLGKIGDRITVRQPTRSLFVAERMPQV